MKRAPTASLCQLYTGLFIGPDRLAWCSNEPRLYLSTVGISDAAGGTSAAHSFGRAVAKEPRAHFLWAIVVSSRKRFDVKREFRVSSNRGNWSLYASLVYISGRDLNSAIYRRLFLSICFFVSGILFLLKEDLVFIYLFICVEKLSIRNDMKP